MDNGWIIGMQPTVPSWVSWYRRAREHGRRDPQRPRARAPSRIALYFNTRTDPHNPYIRLDQMLGQKHVYPLPTLSTVPWRGDRVPLHEPFPIDVSWRVPVPPDLTDIKTVEEGAAHGWGGAWRGWGGGAALLLLLVLLLRAAERCIDTKLFKIRRRESEEWPTATVMATSLQHQQSDLDTLPGLDECDVTEIRRDLPPPYSECNKPDEPPPPYSACYVSFSKHGPSVQIHRQNPEADNVHNNFIENSFSQPSTSYDIDEIRTELVFENGRVVERVSTNPSGNALEASIDDVLENRHVASSNHSNSSNHNNERENVSDSSRDIQPDSSRVLVV